MASEVGGWKLEGRTGVTDLEGLMGEARWRSRQIFQTLFAVSILDVEKTLRVLSE